MLFVTVFLAFDPSQHCNLIASHGWRYISRKSPLAGAVSVILLSFFYVTASCSADTPFPHHIEELGTLHAAVSKYSYGDGTAAIMDQRTQPFPCLITLHSKPKAILLNINLAT